MPIIFSAPLVATGVVRDLGRLGVGIRGGQRELLERVVDEIARPGISHQFQTSGGSDPWEELADSTVERRTRAGLPPGPPLVASGAGRDAATSRDRWAISRTEAVYPGRGWSGAGEYIRHHDEGTRDGHVPARPFGRLEDRNAAKLDAVGLEWLDGRLRGVGF